MFFFIPIVWLWKMIKHLAYWCYLIEIYLLYTNYIHNVNNIKVFLSSWISSMVFIELSEVKLLLVKSVFRCNALWLLNLQLWNFEETLWTRWSQYFGDNCNFCFWANVCLKCLIKLSFDLTNLTQRVRTKQKISQYFA